jgi:hypothetical protein
MYAIEREKPEITKESSSSLLSVARRLEAKPHRFKVSQFHFSLSAVKKSSTC